MINLKNRSRKPVASVVIKSHLGIDNSKERAIRAIAGGVDNINRRIFYLDVMGPCKTGAVSVGNEFGINDIDSVVVCVVVPTDSIATVTLNGEFRSI